jgi:AcrR family transcriptional regulator
MGGARTFLTDDDWVDAAIEVMVGGSVEQVRVERLAKDLGVTKGSFYSRFQNREALLDLVLKRWIQDSTLAVNQRLAQREPLPTLRILAFLQLPFRSKRALRAADLELAVLGWARRSKQAQDAVAEVDQVRVGQLIDLFVEVGYDIAAADFKGNTAYAFLRYLALRRDLSVERRLKMADDLHSLLLKDVPQAVVPLSRESQTRRLDGDLHE